MKQRLARYLPMLAWARHYDRAAATKDSLAALIVTLMLIPQSLAYAMLAGLPPVTGLYASMLPLIAYTLFGTSRTLAVGPVAVVSLMTAAALGPLFAPGSAEYAAAAMLLALLSGAVLLLMAVLRLGFLANFLSHPVISGFISASGILIALGQLKHILGISIGGENAVQLLAALLTALPGAHLPTLAIGGSSLLFLYLVRSRLSTWLQHLGMSPHIAGTLTKIGPVAALLLAIAAVSAFRLADVGVRVVGEVPRGLPSLSLPMLDPSLVLQLLPAAVLISLVGFVESVSVAQTLAAKRRERIEPNQELVALGGANVAAALSGGFPVTGGFARSVVNFDAGAQTPLAGALTAQGIGITVLLFTPLFHNLPHAVLAATIIIAVLSLVDLSALRRTWRYSRQDAAAMAATMLGVLLIGVESGILLGVGLSLLLFLWRTSQPHIAVVGQRTFPQRRAFRRGTEPPCPLGTGRREPLFSQRALSRRPHRRADRPSSAGRTPGADVSRRQPHRRQCAGEPRGHHGTTARRRHPAASVRSQRTGHGSAAPQRFPLSLRRPGFHQPVRGAACTGPGYHLSRTRTAA